MTMLVSIAGSGGVSTRLLPRDSQICSDLRAINHSVPKLFGGAHIPEFMEAGAGVNLWTEWAKLENSITTGSSYSAPEVRNEYAGLVVALARQEWPDTSVFSDPEVVCKLAKRHHVGLVVRSPDHLRVAELIDSYTDIVRKDFHATAPPREKVGY